MRQKNSRNLCICLSSGKSLSEQCMVPIVWKGAGRLRLFFLVRVGGTDTSNTRSALHSKPRQQKFPETGTPKVQVSDSTSNGQISPTSAKNGSQPIVLHAQVLSMSILMCLMITLMIAARLVTWRADMCLK